MVSMSRYHFSFSNLICIYDNIRIVYQQEYISVWDNMKKSFVDGI